MAKIKFIGDPQAAEQDTVISVGGQEFPVGKFVTVTDESLVARLKGNNHFEIEDKDKAVSDGDDQGSGDANPAAASGTRGRRNAQR